jgi:hypothetical protein
MSIRPENFRRNNTLWSWSLLVSWKILTELDIGSLALKRTAVERFILAAEFMRSSPFGLASTCKLT